MCCMQRKEESRKMGANGRGLLMRFSMTSECSDRKTLINSQPCHGDMNESQ